MEQGGNILIGKMNLDTSQKFFSILSTPRSGSTWLLSVLSSYLQKDNFIKVNEMFGFTGSYFKNIPNHFFPIPFKVENSYTKKYYIKDDTLLWEKYFKKVDVDLELEHNLSLLKNLNKKIIIKEQLCRLDEKTSNFLLSYPHLFLIRKDIWGQLLSFLISSNTGIWQAYKDTTDPSIKENSINVELAMVIRFLSEITRVYSIMTANPKSIIIKFEDLNFTDPKLTLQKLGFNNFHNTQFEKIPTKRSYEDKERYFKNIKLIRKIYEDWIKKNQDFLHLSP